jgi:hypothetical protein
MTYVSTTDVYNVAGITTTEVAAATVLALIQDIEADVDRLTNTTYWAEEDSGTATAGATSTLTDSTKTWAVNDYTDEYVWIYSGTGIDQMRKIISNTATQLTVDSAWDINPGVTSKYRIIHAAHDPRVTELRDGDGTDSIFTFRYPIQVIQSITIDGSSVTVSSAYKYTETGEIKLGSSSEESKWSQDDYQANTINYLYGVYPIPSEVKSYVALLAAMTILSTQMGGTHNIPSTYSLPEGSVTIGQAYINIKGTYDVMTRRCEQIEKRIKKYPFLG